MDSGLTPSACPGMTEEGDACDQRRLPSRPPARGAVRRVLHRAALRADRALACQGCQHRVVHGGELRQILHRLIQLFDLVRDTVAGPEGDAGLPRLWLSDRL